jgi:HEAT repeat protein
MVSKIKVEVQRLMNAPNYEPAVAVTELYSFNPDALQVIAGNLEHFESKFGSTLVELLVHANDRKLLPLLQKKLVHPHPDVARVALKVLTQLGKADDFTVGLSHPDPGIRKESLQGLSHQAESRHLRGLVELLKDPSPEVRTLAAATLEATAQRLEFQDAASSHLIDLLTSPNLEARSLTIDLLGALKSPLALDPLERLLGTGRPSEMLQAARALGNLRTPEAHQVLRDALEFAEEETTAQELIVLIMDFLGAAKDREAMPILIPFLEAKTPELQRRAHRALGQISGYSIPADRAQWEKYWEGQQSQRGSAPPP